MRRKRSAQARLPVGEPKGTYSDIVGATGYALRTTTSIPKGAHHNGDPRRKGTLSGGASHCLRA